MMTRTLIAATALTLLLVPVASAHSGHVQQSTDVIAFCSGAIDFLCTHIDCNEFACVRFLCVVYLAHSGHVADFGCTPP